MENLFTLPMANLQKALKRYVEAKKAKQTTPKKYTTRPVPRPSVRPVMRKKPVKK